MSRTIEFIAMIRGKVISGTGGVSRIPEDIFQSRCRAAKSKLVKGSLNIRVGNMQPVLDYLGQPDFETNQTDCADNPLRWWRVELIPEFSLAGNVVPGKTFVVRHQRAGGPNRLDVLSEVHFRNKLNLNDGSKVQLRRVSDAWRPGVAATMCMWHPRWPGSLKTVRSLEGQVDTLYLCLNDFWEIPEELKQDWIEILHFGHNLGDAARLYLLKNIESLNTHLISCDDDIEYPATYVQDFLEAHKEYPNAVLTHHGAVARFKDGKFERYTGGLRVFNDNHEVMRVFLPGSGVLFIPKDIFNQMEFTSLVYLNQLDAHIACNCNKLGVPMIGLRHAKNYIKYTPPPGPTLYDSVTSAPDHLKKMRQIYASYDLSLDQIPQEEREHSSGASIPVATGGNQADLESPKIESLASTSPDQFSSATYWEERYQKVHVKHATAGLGSRNRVLDFKAEIINGVIRNRCVGRLIDWGFGDGYLLSKLKIKFYVGVDISKTAVQNARGEWKDDASKTFMHASEFSFSERFHLSMSIDVIFHLVEDEVFDTYMRQLVESADRYLLIYSSNTVDGHKLTAAKDKHVRHRDFSQWLERHAPEFELIEYIPNRYSIRNPGGVSFSDFYLFRRIEDINPAIEKSLIPDPVMPILAETSDVFPPLMNPWGWLRPSLRSPRVYMIANNKFGAAQVEALLQILEPDDCVVHFNSAVMLSKFKGHPNNVLVLRHFDAHPSGQEKYWNENVANDPSLQAVYFLSSIRVSPELTGLPEERCPAPQHVVRWKQDELLRHIGVPNSGAQLTTGFVTWLMNQMFSPILVGFTSFKRNDGGYNDFHRSGGEAKYLSERRALYLDANGKVSTSKPDDFSAEVQQLMRMAVREGRVDELKQLLQLPQVDVNQPDAMGDTALVEALRENYKKHPEVVKCLLNTPDIDLKQPGLNNQLPLDAALSAGASKALIMPAFSVGRFGILKKILTNPKSKLSAEDLAPLEQAVAEQIKQGNTEMVDKWRQIPELAELLNRHTQQPDAPAMKVEQQRMHEAVRKGDVKELEQLLRSSEVDVNQPDESGNNAFHIAADCGNARAISLLLGGGRFDLQARNDAGQTPLECAEQNGHSIVAAQLWAREAYLALPKVEPSRPSRPKNEKLTFLTVFRSGGEYLPEHVEWLRRQIAEHCTLPHRFYCLSDTPLPCPWVKLQHDWPRWWPKLELFLHDFGPTVFFDLDTVITGNIDWLVDAPDQFSMVTDWFMTHTFTSSMMAWTGDGYRHLADTFKPEKDLKKYAGWDKGDGGWIRERVPDRASLQERFPGKIVSYKVSGKTYPKDAAIVCFHGLPRPWEVAPPEGAAFSLLPNIPETRTIHGVDLIKEYDMVIRHHDTHNGFEPDTVALWCGWAQEASESGALMLDIGAYSGIYAILAAQQGANVLAFEPSKRSYNRMLENIKINRVGNLIQPHNAAVAAASGTSSKIATGSVFMSTAARYALSDTGNTQAVTVDDCVGDKTVAAMKVDVEGEEVPVLEGAIETIKRCLPYIVAEANTKPHEEKIRAVLEDQFGYLIRRVDKRNLICVPPGDTPESVGTEAVAADAIRGKVISGLGKLSRIPNALFQARCKAAEAKLVKGSLNVRVDDLDRALDYLGPPDFTTAQADTPGNDLRWWRVELTTEPERKMPSGKTFVVRHTHTGPGNYLDVLSEVHFRNELNLTDNVNLQLRKATDTAPTKSNKIKEYFTRVYHGAGWRKGESASGYGSSWSNTKHLLGLMVDLFEELNIKRIVDVPCGDFNWMRHFPLQKDMHYTGGDIVDELIESNIKKYKRHNIDFKVMDLTQDSFPDCDVIIIRDCLVHLSFDNILKAFENLKQQNFKYILIGSYTEHPKNKELNGLWRRLNMQLPPFNLPPPLKVLNENYTAEVGHLDKSMCLWNKQDFDQAFSVIIRGSITAGSSVNSRIPDKLFQARCDAAESNLMKGTLNIKVDSLERAVNDLGEPDFETNDPLHKQLGALRWWRVELIPEKAQDGTTLSGKTFVVRHHRSGMRVLEVMSEIHFRTEAKLDDGATVRLRRLKHDSEH